jgi:Holliday junction DNA helicase RuvB
MTTDMLTAELLRPTSFDAYIGQEHMKSQLHVAIESSIARSAPLDHLFLSGPPGCGKTTLGGIVAEQLGIPYFHFECPLTPEDYRSLREAYGVLHFDEVHNLPKVQQEDLRCLTERNYIKPRGMGRIEWDGAVTCILSTTEPGKVIRPLRERCVHQPFFEAYSDEEMQQIATGMAERLGIYLTDDDYMALGKAAAGTPRRIGRFMIAARDLMEVAHEVPNATEILKFMRYTSEGLTPDHIEYMRVLKDNSPLGFSALREFLDLDDPGIRELERLLLKLGYIERSNRGRELSGKGFRRVKELI